jgi:hypothetical protein
MNLKLKLKKIKRENTLVVLPVQLLKVTIRSGAKEKRKEQVYILGGGGRGGV